MRAFEATLSFVEGYTSDIFTKHQVSLNRARNDYRLKVAFLREKAMQLHSLQSNVLCLEINATSATKSTLLDEI
ncbi:hypothetical protein DD238_005496 [Peronospora effusa]|uniref:Uncharacterized protein n=1 Tax=Peronospora effusa TaxID=542832 RepID=A0A3M6VDS1_9STRA|nr:hypothetical protein DD238_005496 [Peronospora effusa]RQM09675.1 hypothetical protein DD237_005568 [Peronospora effusa]